MDISYETVLEEALEAGSYWAGILVSLLVVVWLVAGYVLRGTGMFRIAKRRQIQGAWMAWVPVLNSFLLGRISDQYRLVTRNKKRYTRWILLVLDIIWKVSLLVFAVCMLVVVLQLLFGLLTLGLIFFDEDYVNSMEMMCRAALYMPLVAAVAGLLWAIVRITALHDLYASCDPSCKTRYLLLSIFLVVTEPFCIFFSREKDLGMRACAEQPVEQTQNGLPWADSWE